MFKGIRKCFFFPGTSGLSALGTVSKCSTHRAIYIKEGVRIYSVFALDTSELHHNHRPFYGTDQKQ